MRKCPPGNLKAGSCPMRIHRRTVALLTPLCRAIKPTDRYSGIDCSGFLSKVFSLSRYYEPGCGRVAGGVVFVVLELIVMVEVYVPVVT
jgi:hypothetical protein